MNLQPIGASRVDAVAGLLWEAAAHEDLTPDEILSCCYEQGGVVMASPDTDAVIAVGLGRDEGGELIAAIRLVVVAPAQQRQKLADELFSYAEEWATERGASRIVVGGGLPFSLWPGVAETSAVERVAQRRGYQFAQEWDAFSVSTGFRAEPPPEIRIRRAVHDADVMEVVLWASSVAPRRSDEIARAVENGTCHGAFYQDEVVGVGCHSITRAGWAEPIVVAEQWRRKGVGKALLGQICRDLMIAEFPNVVLANVRTEPATAFLQSVEAKATVRYRLYEKQL